MSEYTPITGELRDAVSRFDNFNGDEVVTMHGADFDRRCDAIDAVHANLERENESLKAELDRVLGEDERDGWMELPRDTDGEYIHIGDVMEGVDKYDSLKKVMGKVITVSFESDGAVDVAIQAWNSDGKSWHRAYLDQYASASRHYHEPTVEDVLREFAEKITDSQIPGVHPTYDEAIAEYAAKLRLTDDEEE